MSTEKSKELQERIVIAIFESAPENWDKYCQYLELIPLDDDFDNSLLSVWFNGTEGAFPKKRVTAYNPLTGE